MVEARSKLAESLISQLKLLRLIDRRLIMQQPNPTNIKQIGLIVPLTGFYDAPDALPFEPLIRSKPSKRAFVFAFYSQLLRGKTLHITEDNAGDGGACHWLFNQETRLPVTLAQKVLSFIEAGQTP
jgi:hypothetical protein